MCDGARKVVDAIKPAMCTIGLRVTPDGSVINANFVRARVKMTGVARLRCTCSRILYVRFGAELSHGLQIVVKPIWAIWLSRGMILSVVRKECFDVRFFNGSAVDQHWVFFFADIIDDCRLHG